MEQGQAQQLLSQIRDIQGIDDVSWWPLALGWWILAALILCFCIGLVIYRRWRAKKATNHIEKIKPLFTEIHTLSDYKEKATALSEIMRYLAIHKYGRKSCAGLEGEKWLNWLKDHDPQNFDWLEKGKALIEVPYMPNGSKIVNDNDFEVLIKAAERWLK